MESVIVYVKWARGYSLAKTITHERAEHWSVMDGCLYIIDGVGEHYYPLTSIARFSVTSKE